ncbi:hypothetical protein [Clostridium tagluense]|nr:hypothetical protein [Clostridium tagluense]
MVHSKQEDLAKEMMLDGENIEKIKKYAKLNEKDIEKFRRELMLQ